MFEGRSNGLLCDLHRSRKSYQVSRRGDEINEKKIGLERDEIGTREISFSLKITREKSLVLSYNGVKIFFQLTIHT